MSWTSEVPILLGAVLVVVIVLPVLGLPLLSGGSSLARCGARCGRNSFHCIKLGLLGVVMFRLMREPVALGGLHGLLGVLPGPPELHALLVALVVVVVVVVAAGVVAS